MRHTDSMSTQMQRAVDDCMSCSMMCEETITYCLSQSGRVDAAYEKRSVAISSNLHPAGFDELMPKTLATATVDRLLHHAHVCQTSGESVRLSEAIAGQGVTPLT